MAALAGRRRHFWQFAFSHCAHFTATGASLFAREDAIGWVGVWVPRDPAVRCWLSPMTRSCSYCSKTNDGKTNKQNMSSNHDAGDAMHGLVF